MNPEAPIEAEAGDGTVTLSEPFDLIRLCLNERIWLRMRNNREVSGILHGYDQHLNMILSDVDEITTVYTVDQETFEERYERKKRKMEMLFIRGDGVVLVSPPSDFHNTSE